jgi:hypothetical protein
MNGTVATLSSKQPASATGPHECAADPLRPGALGDQREADRHQHPAAKA